MTITRIFTHSAQHGAQILAFTWVSSLPKNSGSVIASPWFPQRTHWTCAIPGSLRRDSNTAFDGKVHATVPLTLTPRRARARNGVETRRRPGGGMADAADSKSAGGDTMGVRPSPRAPAKLPVFPSCNPLTHLLTVRYSRTAFQLSRGIGTYFLFPEGGELYDTGPNNQCSCSFRSHVGGRGGGGPRAVGLARGVFRDRDRQDRERPGWRD